MPQLREAIIERIPHGWSPEQVAGRLKLEGGVEVSRKKWFEQEAVLSVWR
ncbi:hypothetical protein [Phyllobacterium sp. CL33Tsu]